MICFTIENPGRLLSDEEVEAMKRVGQSGKSGSSGTHLGLGVPLAEIGIAYARGELQLRPRSTGGLIAMVILPAILNPMNRTTGSTR